MLLNYDDGTCNLPRLQFHRRDAKRLTHASYVSNATSKGWLIMKVLTPKTLLSGMFGGVLLAGIGGGIQRGPDPRLEGRINELEKRVAKLERQVFSQPWMSVEEAQRRIEIHQTRLRVKERLHGKGYISDVEFENARFALVRARKELELAQAGKNGEKSAQQVEAELTVLDARHRLDIAKRQMRLIGFAQPNEGRTLRLAVEEAQRQLEHAVAREKKSADLP